MVNDHNCISVMISLTTLGYELWLCQTDFSTFTGREISVLELFFVWEYTHKQTHHQTKTNALYLPQLVARHKQCGATVCLLSPPCVYSFYQIHVFLPRCLLCDVPCFSLPLSIPTQDYLINFNFRIHISKDFFFWWWLLLLLLILLSQNEHVCSITVICQQYRQ